MSRKLTKILLILLVAGVVGGAFMMIINLFRSDDPPAEEEDEETVVILDPADPGQQVQQEGREPAQLQEAPRAIVEIDDYFSANLDLTGGGRNLTQAYNRQYREADRTPDTLAEFVYEQPIITQLPRPFERTINVQAQDTPIVFSEYMQVAGDLSVFSNQATITEGINRLFGRGNPSIINGLALRVRGHQEKLVDLRVPPSALDLHRLLLGYTELLATTYEQMALYTEDPVRGVTAMHQLEQIDKRFYPVIEQEVNRLNAYNRQLNNR